MPLMGSLYVGTSGLQTSQNALNTQQQGTKPGQKPMFQKGGKNQPAKKQAPVKKQPLKVEIPDEIVVSDLASRLKVTVGEVA